MPLTRERPSHFERVRVPKTVLRGLTARAAAAVTRVHQENRRVGPTRIGAQPWPAFTKRGLPWHSGQLGWDTYFCEVPEKCLVRFPAVWELGSYVEVDRLRGRVGVE